MTFGFIFFALLVLSAKNLESSRTVGPILPSVCNLIVFRKEKISNVFYKKSLNMFSCDCFRLAFECREMEPRESNSSYSCARHEPLKSFMIVSYVV